MALHEQFAKLGMGVRRYAETVYCDKATVSRSLSAKVVPTPQFIEDLAKRAAEADGTPEQAESIAAGLLDLCWKAIASSGTRSDVARLRNELAGARLEVLGHEATIARLRVELEEAVEARDQLRQELADMYERRDPLYHSAHAYRVVTPATLELRQERSDLEELIFDLERRLVQNVSLKQEALQHCGELVERLAMYIQVHGDDTQEAQAETEKWPESDRGVVVLRTLPAELLERVRAQEETIRWLMRGRQRRP